MDRSPARTRAFFLLLLAAHAGLFFAAGGLTARLGAGGEDRGLRLGVLAVITATLVVSRGFVMSQLPAIVRNAHWRLLRPMVCWELGALAGLASGLKADPGLTVCWPVFILA